MMFNKAMNRVKLTIESCDFQRCEFEVETNFAFYHESPVLGEKRHNYQHHQRPYGKRACGSVRERDATREEMSSTPIERKKPHC